MAAFEDAKGEPKEAPMGDVTGSDTLRQEGQAQQRKAEEPAEAATARASAQAHEARAAGVDQQESAEQGT